MQVNLYATFRLHAGVRRFALDLPGGVTLQQAIEAIIEQYPVLRAHWLDNQGALYAHVHAFVNGVDAGTLPQGLNTTLQPTDVLDFFPPVAGG
jgi:molybdopterin synthase sulfur carrier subunit